MLATGFAERHLVQWNALVKKMGEGALANRSGEIIEDLRKFAIPMFRCIALSERIVGWQATGGWLIEAAKL
jgi:hypothetical protein